MPPVDIVGTTILLVYLGGLAALGLGISGTSTDVEDFYLAGRSIGPVVLAFTIVATYLSTSAFVGNPGLASNLGYAFVWVGPPQAVATVLMYMYLGEGIRNVSEKLNARTFPEIFHNRFDSRLLSLIPALIIVILMIPYTVIILRGGGLLAEQLINVPYWVAVVGLGVFIAMYTSIGGFKAVAITDLIQGIILTAGLLILIPNALSAVGGFTGLSETLLQEAPQKISVPGPGGWGTLVGLVAVFSIGMLGQPQLLVRFMTGEKGKNKTSAIIAALVTVVFTTFVTFMGVISFALFGIEGDQAMPVLIENVLPGGIGLLVLVAGIAAARSTVDSVAFMAAQGITNDIVVNGMGKEIEDENLHRFGRYTVIVLVVIAMGFAFNPPQFILQLTAYVFSAFAGTFLVPTLGLLYWERMTETGCASGMLGGALTTVIWEELGVPLGISPLFIGVLSSAILLITISLLTTSKNDNLYPTSPSKTTTNQR